MWLSRIVLPVPYYCLCLTKKQFRKALKLLGQTDNHYFVKSGAHATTHVFASETGGVTCVVCLDIEESESNGRTQAEILALLTHEAVHVYQEIKYAIPKPDDETEAYIIQGISQQLFESYFNFINQR